LALVACGILHWRPLRGFHISQIYTGRRMRKLVKTFIFFIIFGACILGFYVCGKWELGMWMKIGKVIGNHTNVMNGDR
jgi:hypothetical protein